MDKYDVDLKLKNEFAPDKFNEYLNIFKQIDINKNGTLNKEEIIKGKSYI